MKYAFCQSQRGDHDVVLMCRVLEVSRSGYYAWRGRAESARRKHRRGVLGAIRRIHGEVDQVYGAPRMHRELREQGITCGRHLVARVMREAGLKAKRRHLRHPRTTNSNHTLPVAPNILEQRFVTDQPNRVWIGDITYVGTGEGWLYLAVLVDLFSRRVVGWSMDRAIDRWLTLGALGMALKRRRPRQGLVHHTDRGSQYASTDYQIELERAGIVCSMSRKGNCYDNAVAESFFATLKTELVRWRRWSTRQEAQTELFEYIEGFYNQRRRHSALGYRSPASFEAIMSTS